MLTRWLVAAIHLLGLGIGLGAVWARAHALRGMLDRAGLERVFYADTWWGVAALVWISTGLMRAFGGLEKGTAYYLNNHWFLAKMGALVLVLALEVRPMLTLIRWRTLAVRGQGIDTRSAASLSRVSLVQAGLVLFMVLAAAAMARGLGART